MVESTIRTVGLTKDVVARASKMLPSAKPYLDSMLKGVAKRHAVKRDINEIVFQFSKLPRAVRGQVNGYLRDARLEQRWGYSPGHLKGVAGVTVDPAMKARFEALPEAAREVVRRVFQHGHDDSLMEMRRQALEPIETESDAVIGRLAVGGESAQHKGFASADGAMAVLDVVGDSLGQRWV